MSTVVGGVLVVCSGANELLGMAQTDRHRADGVRPRTAGGTDRAANRPAHPLGQSLSAGRVSVPSRRPEGGRVVSADRA
jgi:hypothetical protein